MIISIRETEILLLPEKAIFFLDQRILVLADMHLGKLVHFRKKGIFAPVRTINEDLETMLSLIKSLEPNEVVFLGDLFHSEANSEYHHFIEAVELFPKVQFTLTKGNHDIIPEALFNDTRIEITSEKVLKNNIVLRHQLPKALSLESFYIIGHIHPGYRFHGMGRQNYTLSCYHRSGHFLTLPAFGKHTGLFTPDFLPEDAIYVIMNEEVVKIPNRMKS